MSEQLIISELNNHTNVIKYKEKSIVNNFIDIGKELKIVKDGKLYKEEYSTFENYVESNFTFTRMTAYNMIKVSDCKDDFTKLGLYKCLLLLQAPEEHREELKKKAKKMSVKKLKEEVKKVIKPKSTNKKEENKDFKPIIEQYKKWMVLVNGFIGISNKIKFEEATKKQKEICIKILEDSIIKLQQTMERIKNE